MRAISELRLDGLLSFAPGSPPFELSPLNVLIGPNGSGKSNLIEAVELLKATPLNFASAVRDGGGASEWLWKGRSPPAPATIEAVLEGSPAAARPIRYRLEFTTVQSRVEVIKQSGRRSAAKATYTSTTDFSAVTRSSIFLAIETLRGRSRSSARTCCRISRYWRSGVILIDILSSLGSASVSAKSRLFGNGLLDVTPRFGNRSRRICRMTICSRTLGTCRSLSTKSSTAKAKFSIDI